MDRKLIFNLMVCIEHEFDVTNQQHTITIRTENVIREV